MLACLRRYSRERSLKNFKFHSHPGNLISYPYHTVAMDEVVGCDGGVGLRRGGRGRFAAEPRPRRAPPVSGIRCPSEGHTLTVVNAESSKDFTKFWSARSFVHVFLSMRRPNIPKNDDSERGCTYFSFRRNRILTKRIRPLTTWSSCIWRHGATDRPASVFSSEIGNFRAVRNFPATSKMPSD